MMAEPGQRPVYICAEWEIDLARRELRASGELVPLGGRAFEILAELVQAQGQLVTKNDLTERVWRGVFVEESALRVHIAAIRKALGPDRDMLSTTVGRGYRLLGAWRLRQKDAPLQSAAAGLPPSINHSVTLPSGSFTATWNQEWGLTISHLINEPFRVSGLLTSNSAANAWCARA